MWKWEEQAQIHKKKYKIKNREKKRYMRCIENSMTTHTVQKKKRSRWLKWRNGIIFFITIICCKYQQCFNHLGGDPVIRAWNQEVCSLCGLRFKPCGCSYDGHWRLTWSLTSGPVGLVEVRASWPGHPR